MPPGRRRTSLLLLALVVLVALALLERPLAPAGLVSHPHPTASYGEALGRLATLAARDGPGVSPECRTRLMSHGARTTRVVVLLHGLTNCPEQFRVLGERFYARGANVLIPRLPRHGLADRMTTQLARLDARALCDATDEALDVADGLGDTVVVLGLSAGGVMAAWAAQERADVACAVPIAPLLATGLAHGLLTPAATRLGLALPNEFVWWDSRAREDLGGPKHVYPRFATRAVAECMVLGAAIEDQARRARPRARSIVMITVGGDVGVDNRACERLVDAWRAHGAPVVAYQFPARLHLNHDIIDPEQVGANPALVYPVIEGLVAP